MLESVAAMLQEALVVVVAILLYVRFVSWSKHKFGRRIHRLPEEFVVPDAFLMTILGEIPAWMQLFYGLSLLPLLTLFVTD